MLQEIRTVWTVDTKDIEAAKRLMSEAAKEAGVAETDVNRLNGAYQQTAKSIQESSKQFTELRARVERLASRERELLTLRSQTNDPRKLAEYDRALGRVRARLADIATEDKDRIKRIQQLERLQTLLNKRIEQSGDAKKIAEYERKLEDVNAEMNRLVINANRSEKELEQLGIAGTKSGNLLRQGIQAGIGFFGANLLLEGVQGISRAVGQFFGDSVREAEAFETQIQSLSGILGISGKRLETLAAQAQNFEVSLGGFGDSIRVNATELTESVSDLASLSPGLLKSEQALLGVQEKVLLLSKTDLKLETGQATQAVASLINNFGLIDDNNPSKTIENVNQTVQQLAETSRLSASRVPLTADALNEVGGGARAINVSLPETLSLIGTLSENSALLGSRGGVALRNFFATLEAGPDATNPKVVGLQKALENLEPTLNQGGALIDIFGRENATAARLLIENRAKVQDLTAALSEGGLNTAYKQAAANTQTAASSSEKFSGAIDRLQSTVGQKFLGFLSSVRSGVASVINSFTDLIAVPVEDKIRAEQNELNLLVNALANTAPGEQERARLITELNNKYPDFLANIDAENASSEQLVGALNDVNNAYVKRIAISRLTERLKDSQELLAESSGKLVEESTKAGSILNLLIKQYPQLKQVQDRARASGADQAEQFKSVAAAIREQGIALVEIDEFGGETVKTFAGQFVTLSQNISRVNNDFQRQFGAVENIKGEVQKYDQALNSLLGTQGATSGSTQDLAGNQEQVNNTFRSLVQLEKDLAAAQDNLKNATTDDQAAAASATVKRLEQQIKAAKLRLGIKADSSQVLQAKREVEALAERIESLQLEVKISRAGGADSFAGQDILEQQRIKELEADKAFQALRIKNEQDAAAILLQERVKFAEARAKITEDQTAESLTVQKNKEIENIRETNAFKSATVEDQKRIELQIETTYNQQIEALKKSELQKDIERINQRTQSQEEAVSQRVAIATDELTRLNIIQASRLEQAYNLESLSVDQRTAAIAAFVNEKRKLEAQALINEGDFAGARKLIEEDVNAAKIQGQIEYLRKVLEVNRTVRDENAAILSSLQFSADSGGLDDSGQAELKARTELQAKLNKAVLDGEKALQDAVTNQAKEGLESREELEKESIDRRIQTGFDAIDQIYNSTADLVDGIKAVMESLAEGGEDLGQRLGDAAQGALGVISGFYALQAQAFEQAKQRELNAAGDNAAKRAEIEKKYAQQTKRTQKAQAIIGAAKAAISIFSAPAVLPQPADFILKLALAGAVAAQTRKQIQLIDSQGFREGVVNLHGPGTETSDSIPAKLSKGESVITAKQTRRHIDLLTEIHKGRVLKPVQLGKGLPPVYAFDDERVKQAAQMMASQPVYQDQRLQMAEYTIKRPDILLSQPNSSTFVNVQEMNIDYGKLADTLAPRIAAENVKKSERVKGKLWELLRETQNKNIEILNELKRIRK